jgi:hypothetical protein
MSLKMSERSREEVLRVMRERYARRQGRAARMKLLDEFCELCGYERKYAIKLLGGRRRLPGRVGHKSGSKPKYGEAERRVLKVIWLACEQPCGKRLKAAVPLWLPDYEREHGMIDAEVRDRLMEISAATLDRLLGVCRAKLGSRGRCGTRPGSLLRNHIPIRTEHWDVSGPGWLEADTVAHCGESMAGDFCWSVTLTDVHTQWTETRAVWNKGQHAVQQRIAEVEAALPFAILGFDSDNGGEFINWHLADYFLLRRRAVAFTRSRAYRKNDNARVEQKNWTHVRQLVGYGRLGDTAQADQLNDLYVKEWNLFRNFFCPAMKHLRTEVEGSRKKRIYDKPATPFERLKACAGVDPAQIQRLEELKAALNPFELKRRIEKKLRRVLGPPNRARLRAAA